MTVWTVYPSARTTESYWYMHQCSLSVSNSLFFFLSPLPQWHGIRTSPFASPQCCLSTFAAKKHPKYLVVVTGNPRLPPYLTDFFTMCISRRREQHCLLRVKEACQHFDKKKKKVKSFKCRNNVSDSHDTILSHGLNSMIKYAEFILIGLVWACGIWLKNKAYRKLSHCMLPHKGTVHHFVTCHFSICSQLVIIIGCCCIVLYSGLESSSLLCQQGEEEYQVEIRMLRFLGNSLFHFDYWMNTKTRHVQLGCIHLKPRPHELVLMT